MPRWVSALCAGAGALALWFAPLAAQNPPVKKPPVPRAADGHPDLSGVWQGSVAFSIGEENAKKLTPPAPQALDKNFRSDPAPLQPWAAAKAKEYRDRRLIDDPSGKCLMVGIPRITSMPMPFQIIQTPGQVAILYESFHSFRVIPTDGRKHPEDIDPGYLGDSVARWEGDTLVVDVTGFNGKTWIAPAVFHSDALHVTERYTRADFDTLLYEATMEDPEVFTKPWTIRWVIRLRPGERLREYECIENNEDLLRFEEILKNDPLYKEKP
jgi:hypothetical protein